MVRKGRIAVMDERTVKVLNVPFITKSKREIVHVISEDFIKKSKKGFVVTANPEIVMKAQEDSGYFRTIQNADFIIPDGIGVIIASKIISNPLQERIPGFELMEELLQLAHEEKLKVFLLGAKESVVEKAARNIQKKYSNLQLVGYHHGFFSDDDVDLSTYISSLKPDLVFVALGFPRQEFWIEQNLPLFEKGVFMGVGGSIDVFAGEVKRAPKIFQKMHLEWFYRLVKQPTRWRRMLVLPRFILKVVKEK
jgi:N-acetylglucosaminyldiphosphoundecaprenol N-acetyl-beta-D-mannosaminyltransferase